MKIADRYILSRFLKILGFCLLAFLIVVVLVDVIENIDRFIDFKVPLALVAYYYLFYAPFMLILTLPVAVLIATMFTVGSLAKYHELTVMKASGRSLYRLALPLLITGFVISLATIIFTDRVMVPAEARRKELKKREIDKRVEGGMLLTNIIKPGRDGWVVFARTYNEAMRMAEDVTVQRFSDDTVTVSITAAAMIWVDSCWVLKKAARREFHGGQETMFAMLDSLRADFLSHTPATMSYRQKDPRNTGFFELLDLIKLKRLMHQDTAKEEVELYLKITYPFSSFILVLLGLPLAANPSRASATVGFGLGVAISFVYFVTLRAGQSFGYTHKLHPLLAASIGNLIFFLVGIVLFIKARK